MVLEFAKRFALAGYFVFPMYKSSKGPQPVYGWARNKVKDDIDPAKIIPATDDVNVIDQWPELIEKGYGSEVAGYGVLGIGYVLFDLDNKDGKQGSIRFKELRTKFNLPNPNFVVKSKSGGYHLYYDRPERLKSLELKTLANVTIAGEKYEGVDLRGNGGYVVGPQCEGPEDDWQKGQYQIILGGPEAPLSALPEKVLTPFIRTKISSDLESLSELTYDTSDVFEVLKRGEIPESLPLGQRNEGFYIYLNALKNKGFTKETAAKMAQLLKNVTEGLDSFDESVPLKDMIERVFTVKLSNPSDVCLDLFSHGLYRLNGHKNRIMYVILNDNPYIESRGTHDLQGMRQLLAKYSRKVMTDSGKEKVLNPADIIDVKITSANEVDTLGFKPGASDIFTLTTDSHGRKYLNTWRNYAQGVTSNNVVDKYWDDYLYLISRIFGPEGSEEFNLGLDYVAWILQNPGVKPSIAPFIMSSRRGVGKSLWMGLLQNIFGYNKLGELQAKPLKVDEVSSRFFDPTGSCVLLFDEVQFAVHRDMRRESAHFWRHLKNLVTSEIIPVEFKGGATVQMPNMSGVILAGNSGGHFPIEEFDRRIWIIDNDPPELTYGLLDDFFLLVKGQLNGNKKAAILNTLKYRLLNHKIKLRLDSMRAPMNEIKKEMYLSTLSDIEEWWITHFDDPDSLLAATPVLSKSAIIFLIETSDRLMNTKFREDPEGTFRELRRRGLIKPIRLQSDNYQSRNIHNVPKVSPSGEIVEADNKREVLYTTKMHGDYNSQSNEVVLQAYIKNLHSIKKWREKKIHNRGNVVTQLDKEANK